jgi:hypothetical protein
LEKQSSHRGAGQPSIGPHATSREAVRGLAGEMVVVRYKLTVCEDSSPTGTDCTEHVRGNNRSYVPKAGKSWAGQSIVCSRLREHNFRHRERGVPEGSHRPSPVSGQNNKEIHRRGLD